MGEKTAAQLKVGPEIPNKLRGASNFSVTGSNSFKITPENSFEWC